MGTDTPISDAAFAAAVGRLDGDELAAFVGDLRDGPDAAVTVDPPVVTVEAGDERTDLYVAPEGRLPADGPAVDAVVTGRQRSVAGWDGRVVSPTDLRRRLLYARSPSAADALAERHLDAPAWTDAEPNAAVGPPDSPDDPSAATTVDDGTDADPTGRRIEREHRDDPQGPDGAGDAATATGVRGLTSRLAVGGVLVLVVLAVASGAGPLDGLPGEADAGPAAVEPDPDAATTATATARGDGAGTPTERPGGNESTAARSIGENRNVVVEPNCRRSPLLVVQIQMNALKFNDDATNDGIRTVRRFASPQNRRTVGSFDAFVTVVRSESYAPMLSYDSARYAPGPIDDRTATVGVVTAVDGDVTGRYEFRLGKQEGGVYDGCWMTDSVRSLPVNESA